MTEAFLVRHYGVPNLHLCREGYEYVVCPACGSHIVLERDFVDQWFEIEGDGWARVDEYDQTRVVLHTQCDWEHHGARTLARSLHADIEHATGAPPRDGQLLGEVLTAAFARARATPRASTCGACSRPWIDGECACPELRIETGGRP